MSNKLSQISDKLSELNNNLTVKEYASSDFNFNSFYEIMEFQCFRLGRIVYLNMELYIKSGTIVASNTVYSFNGKTIPTEIKPKRNTLLQGFCCDGDFGNATQISTYISKDDGCIHYSMPVSKSYVAVQGFWLLDA